MALNDHYSRRRQHMVEHQIQNRGINDPRLLDALRRVPRHEFVTPGFRDAAYEDAPLPIGSEQTISQPYIVALMTQALRLKGDENVLEIGTGSGYQTAILCELANYVYTLERKPLLADRAASVLSRLGYDNVDIHMGDGSQGLPDCAPFDTVIVTAAAPAIPGPLRSQLSPNGGRMIIPVGDSKGQELQLVVRNGDKFEVRKAVPVRFVPLIGRFGFKNKKKKRGNGGTATV